MEELTIKFGKGLCTPFTSKSGVEMMRIRILNEDPADKSPWAQFVLRANQVHENKFGKGLWAKLPVDGTTKVTKAYLIGETDGKKVWGNDEMTMSNSELKAKVEAYKARDRESAVDQLSEARKEAATKSSGRSSRSKKPQLEK